MKTAKKKVVTVDIFCPYCDGEIAVKTQYCQNCSPISDQNTEETKMTEVKAIQQQIREVRKEMKERGIRKVSCFNGGLDSGTYRANAELFRLSIALEDAKKREVTC